jgi:hypothetical protein
MPDRSATLKIGDLYKRPLQVSRYLRQFPSPRSPNWSLLRQACLNSPHTSLRTGLWQVSRYLRQFPSPRSPSASLFSQARRNCSHCPPPRPSYTRTPPGPTSMDWEKAEIGITKKSSCRCGAEHILAHSFQHFLILQLLCTGEERGRGGLTLVDGSGRSGRYRLSPSSPLVGADLYGLHCECVPCVYNRAAWSPFHGWELRLWGH